MLIVFSALVLFFVALLCVVFLLIFYWVSIKLYQVPSTEICIAFILAYLLVSVFLFTSIPTGKIFLCSFLSSSLRETSELSEERAYELCRGALG